MPVYMASHLVGRPASVTSMTNTKVFVSKHLVQFDILLTSEYLNTDVHPCYVAVTRLFWLFTRVMFCVSLTACCVLQINNPVLHRLSHTHMHTVWGTHHVQCGRPAGRPAACDRSVGPVQNIFILLLPAASRPLCGAHTGSCSVLVMGSFGRVKRPEFRNWHFRLVSRFRMCVAVPSILRTASLCFV